MTTNRKDKPPYQTPLLTKLDELNGVKGEDFDISIDCETGSSNEEGCKDGGVAEGFGCEQGTDATET